MTDKTPLLTDKEIDQIHLEEWSDDGEYRIVLRVARRVQTLVAERAAAAEREAIILLADEMDVERTEYCMSVYEEGEQYKHNLLEAIRARSRA